MWYQSPKSLKKKTTHVKETEKLKTECTLKLNVGGKKAVSHIATTKDKNIKEKE